MPDDTQDLEIALEKADGSERFDLKANNVERSHNNSMIIKSVLQAAGDVVGADPDLGFETYSIQGVIQETQQGTYPEEVTIDKSAYNRAVEKEMNLSHAMNEWGPDADLENTSVPFDTLYWGPREIPGMMTKYSATEDASGERGPGKFTFTVEWTFANVILY